MRDFTQRDWRDIQEAVSNSDLPNERRIGLLDKIDTMARYVSNAGKTNSRTWGAVVPR